MRVKSVILIILILGLAQAASAGELTLKIQKQYDSLKSFKAEFRQELTNAASGEVERRSGTIAFKQPSLIRWDTVSPEKELLVVGKSVVWDYFPAEQTAMKFQSAQVFNSKTMIRFLSGKARLDEDFQVLEQGEEGGLTKLKLIPHEAETGLVEAWLWAEASTGLIKKVLVKDFYGNGNMVALSGLTLNPSLPDSQFEFTPPAGVIVQDNTRQ